MSSCPAAIERFLTDPDWVLAHFTLAADLTTLREDCRLVRSGETVMLRYLKLPFPALAFLGEEPGLLADLAAQLVSPDEAFYLLLNERQARLAERTFAVEEVHPEWQMLFAAGDLASLAPGAAVRLEPGDLAQMHDLAANAGLSALETNPFRHGPVFGVWERERLVAMAGTRVQIPGAVEIGNIATRSTHRRRGYARQSVSALVRAHSAVGQRVFLMVFQSNQAAIQLYEGLGFVRRRPMFLLRCRLEAG
jgi:ribosomal protein S18 acetylase RimI-like enzyme